MFLHVGEIATHEEMGLFTGFGKQGSVVAADGTAPDDGDLLK